MLKRALGLLAAFTLTATGAYAHPRLISASPSAGAHLVGSPREVRIIFNETIFARLSGVTIRSFSGALAKTGRATVDVTKTQLVAPIFGNLAPGRYIVVWRAVSTDTHRVAGKFDFTVK